MRLRRKWAVAAVAIAGVLALSGCTGQVLNDPDVEPNLEPVAQEPEQPSLPPADEPDEPEFDDEDDDTDHSVEFIASCLDYDQFNYEYEQKLDEALSGEFIESEEDLQSIRETMLDASEAFDEVVENSDDDYFISQAEEVRPLFEVFEDFTDPDISDGERFRLMEEMEGNPAFDAEDELVQECNEAVAGY